MTDPEIPGSNPFDGERLPGLGGAWVAAIIVVAISLLSTFTLASPDADTNAVQYLPSGPGESGPSEEAAEGTADAGPSVRRVTRGGRGSAVGGEAGSFEGGDAGAAGSAGAGGQYDCSKNENAGATDIGITGDTIRLAATVVKTGIAKDFLADAQFGIEAVQRKVNAAGGICGRRLDITFDDDGWDPANGQRIIEKWIGEKKTFALVVNPSSEGLRGAIKGKLISQNEFPVVGADGMLIGQYREPWVWPVATSTHSVMHIMVKDAFERAKTEIGGRKPRFAIVWESNYRFGVEGHRAFVGAVQRGGGEIVADTELHGATSGGGAISYGPQASDFVGKCKADGKEFAGCDFVAMLLEPATAAQWVNDNGLGSGDPRQRPPLGIGAPQPLFVTSFIRDCGAPCTGLRVWTSFEPPTPPFDKDPKVAEYLSDLRAVSNSADASNPHVQGAYVGTQLLVEALKRLEAEPTRQGLRKILDRMSFDSGLAPTLTFSEENHFAAVSAQAFEAVFNVNDFNSWRWVDRGFVTDTEVAQDQTGDE